MIDSSARNRIVILDCCFAGRAIEWMAAPGGPDAGHLDISGTHVLTATSATRHAHAPEGARHTAFTAALIDLLRRGTPDAGSLIRISDIYPNLVRALRSRGLPTPQQRGTDAIGDLALTRNPAWR
jgi:ATP-dependent Clp protease ATP-binding subunit ClpC